MKGTFFLGNELVLSETPITYIRIQFSVKLPKFNSKRMTVLTCTYFQINQTVYTVRLGNKSFFQALEDTNYLDLKSIF